MPLVNKKTLLGASFTRGEASRDANLRHFNPAWGLAAKQTGTQMLVLSARSYPKSSCFPSLVCIIRCVSSAKGS
jgi:hypothetical protein